MAWGRTPPCLGVGPGASWESTHEGPGPLSEALGAIVTKMEDGT